jgi:FkbM family methyltransferase
MSIRRRVARLAKRLGWYEPLRRARYWLHPPDWFVQQQRDIAIYRRFVQPGDLCFDIGANAGVKTVCFRALGARVVAVEPVPSALAALRAEFHDDDAVTIVAAAVGRSTGEADIHLGDSSTISTLSDVWLERARTLARLEGREWVSTHRVPVTTLDALTAAHGAPQFCKIDVEGYEAEVVAGLSVPIPRLSFEFQAEYPDVPCRVIDRLESLARYSFNYCQSGDDSFRLQHWVSADAIKLELTRLRDASIADWGDVYAVLASQKTELGS